MLLKRYHTGFTCTLQPVVWTTSGLDLVTRTSRMSSNGQMEVLW